MASGSRPTAKLYGRRCLHDRRERSSTHTARRWPQYRSRNSKLDPYSRHDAGAVWPTSQIHLERSCGWPYLATVAKIQFTSRYHHPDQPGTVLDACQLDCASLHGCLWHLHGHDRHRQLPSRRPLCLSRQSLGRSCLVPAHPAGTQFYCFFEVLMI